jgi:hypothetical protein
MSDDLAASHRRHEWLRGGGGVNFQVDTKSRATRDSVKDWIGVSAGEERGGGFFPYRYRSCPVNR